MTQHTSSTPTGLLSFLSAKAGCWEETPVGDWTQSSVAGSFRVSTDGRRPSRSTCQMDYIGQLNGSMAGKNFGMDACLTSCPEDLTVELTYLMSVRERV